MGTKAILLHRKSEIREAMKERIMAGVGQNEMVQLRFSLHDAKTQLAWEHSKDFEYRYDMYDVVKSEQWADSVTYWCIHDKAEAQINRQLETLAAATGSDPQQQTSLDHFFSFLKSLFCEAPTAAQPIADNTEAASFHVYFFAKYPYSRLPTSPPPEA
jgi:adenosine deaminase